MHGAANKVYHVPLTAKWIPDPHDPMGAGNLFLTTHDAHGFEHPSIPNQVLEVQFGPFKPQTIADLVPGAFLKRADDQVQRVLHPGYTTELYALHREGKVAVIGLGQFHKNGITRFGKTLAPHDSEHEQEL